MEKRIIQVEEKVPLKLLIPLSIQHMFATVSYTHLDVYKRQPNTQVQEEKADPMMQVRRSWRKSSVLWKMQVFTGCLLYTSNGKWQGEIIKR